MKREVYRVLKYTYDDEPEIGEKVSRGQAAIERTLERSIDGTYRAGSAMTVTAIQIASADGLSPDIRAALREAEEYEWMPNGLSYKCRNCGERP